jgi:hypothetical protein
MFSNYKFTTILFAFKNLDTYMSYSTVILLITSALSFAFLLRITINSLLNNNAETANMR